MKRPANFKDMTGKRFGRLVVLEEAPKNPKYTTAIWHCQCDCGNKISTSGAALRKGNTKSCGCLQKEITCAFARNRKKMYGSWVQDGGSFDEVFADY